LSMLKISQLLLRTEKSLIPRPLNLGRHDLKQNMKMQGEMKTSIDAIFKAEIASFVKFKESYKSNKGKAYTTP